jgi:hypothetical protein
LFCPSRHHRITYQETVIGGLKPVERWDYYECQRCSLRFKYRQRTRRLTVISDNR